MISGASDATEFGINADHRRMTKFPDVENEDFTKLARILKFMIQKAGGKVKNNWALESKVCDNDFYQSFCHLLVLLTDSF